MRTDRRLSTVFWATTLVIALCVWTLIALALHQLQRQALESAATTRRNLASSLAQYEESSVRAIDLSLRYLRDDWQRDRASFAAAVERHEAYLSRERVIQVAVVDRDGWLVFSKLPQSGALNFADRDYFQGQKTSGADALVISPPVLGRVTRHWAIQFSRPLHDRGGFAGLIVVAVPVPALEQVYADIDLGKDGVVTLARLDGAILARTGDPAKVAGVSFAGFPGIASASPPTGDFRGTGLVDGVERFFSYQRLEDYPLTLYVGQSVDTVLAPYRTQRALAVGGGLIASVLLLILARQLALRARAEAELAASERRFLEERERMMLELHDGCIQSIYAIGLRLEHCRGLVRGDPGTARTIAEAEASLNLVIQDLRAFMTGSAPAALSPEEFSAELRRMLPVPGAAAPALSLELEPAALERLSPGQVAHVLRIAREALSNVARHAGARSVRVALRRAGQALRLEIDDDGAGFAVEQTVGAGLGLHHIRVRAGKLGGRATIDSAPRQGTRIGVEFPAAA